MPLIIHRKVNEEVHIRTKDGEVIEIKVLEYSGKDGKGGGGLRVAIQAPQTMEIRRGSDYPWKLDRHHPDRHNG